ncbi:hypothetical protein DH2020_015648 [Rehmannia glutinosa]|uniref:Uncharacterized protein n=1 Tax=Rehmannia glutinosa TaxID=99300 RepID=A0ABR0WUT7_REHGL
MYRDLKMHYWWPGMKGDIAQYMEQCLTCQQIKAEHKRPAGTLQPLPIPEWKWERITMDFVTGDQVFLKVAPMKGIMQFGKKGKLSPRYIGPFYITERIGEVAYRLDLPASMSQIHDVFHVFMLRKYVSNPSHILTNEPIELKTDFSYEEIPVGILLQEVKKLRNKEIPLVKVLWRNQSIEEATWEREDEMRAKYPNLFR